MKQMVMPEFRFQDENKGGEVKGRVKELKLAQFSNL